jgi:hypothetical protein
MSGRVRVKYEVPVLDFSIPLDLLLVCRQKLRLLVLYQWKCSMDKMCSCWHGQVDH